MSKYYPILLKPVYQDNIWGGTQIPKRYHREAYEGICAESWEVSTRPEGMSIVKNGKFKGLSLVDVIEQESTDILGTKYSDLNELPLLIKLIDSKQKLSVQVHPNNENAHLTGGEPKTEMWYILDADPGAIVYAGLKPNTSKEAFQQGMENNTLEQFMEQVSVKKGTTIFIPGGTVHAIAEGCLLLEVQQSSNTTYRVYDWGRVGHDGKPRELHIKKAMDTINFNQGVEGLIKDPVVLAKTKNSTLEEYVSCPYFNFKKLTLNGTETITKTKESFYGLFIESGEATIKIGDNSETLKAGTSCLIPGVVTEFDIQTNKNSEIIIYSAS
ncbi:MAG: class I mannose-6-phosphate isomerase [Kiritimatiellae bacterium]|nr:class I mannose-6-phosphate isomerase [Kiritimatiellia bacterium]